MYVYTFTKYTRFSHIIIFNGLINQFKNAQYHIQRLILKTLKLTKLVDFMKTNNWKCNI